MSLVIKNGTLIGTNHNEIIKADIFIEKDRIKAIGQNLEGENILDVQGKFVFSGFIDIHVHLREPGFEQKETIKTGSAAAALGGYTTIVAMANTNPVVDNLETLEYIKEKAAKAHINVFQVASVTKNLEGKELSPVEDLIANGAIAISDDGKPVYNSSIMKEALIKANSLNVPLLSHCEDPYLFHGGSMNYSQQSKKLNIQGIPKEAEEIMVARDIVLAKSNNVPVHICHVSTKGSINLIRQAKKEGVKVSCEAAPHHFILTDDIIDGIDCSTKVNPPIRNQADVDAIIEGLFDGTIDAIATDHAPHEVETKLCEYQRAAFGISSIQCSVSLIIDELYHRRGMDLLRLAQLMSSNPAKIMGLRERGSLTEGSIADITILDINKTSVIVVDTFESKGKNCPFNGRRVTGLPYATIVGGKIKMLDGRLLDDNR